jgi:CRP-like cAMP-binding protein
MSNDYVFHDPSQIFRNAIAAEESGDYKKAYKLFGELWESDFWSHDQELVLHYANASEQVGDYKKSLKLYTQLMKTMTINPTETTGVLVQTSMSRLHDLVHDSTLEGKALDTQEITDEARLVNELFKEAERRSLNAGDLICEVEDIANDMWLLVEGEVDVELSGVVTTTLKGSRTSPCLMGEVAYFTALRRAATLRCKTDVKLLELSFQNIATLKGKDERIQPLLDYMFRSRLGYHLLGQHPVFKKLPEAERKEAAISLRHVNFLPSKIIIEQGQPRNSTFMVQSGTLLMLKMDDDGEHDLIASMHPGDIFHLGGLLQSFKAPYRVVTGTPCRLLRLQNTVFEPILKKHPSLVKDILEYSREESERHILHPEKDNLWAADRYIKFDGN